MLRLDPLTFSEFLVGVSARDDAPLDFRYSA